MAQIKLLGFSLAKGEDLVGDDSFEVKKIDNRYIGIVCDGVGSADGGREAAKRTTTYLLQNLKSSPISWDLEKSIKKFIQNINSILYNESLSEYERVELLTTVALAVIEGNRLYGANVGDSRIYLIRDNKLYQLSKDHSQEHILTSAIGMSEDIEIYYFENNIKEGDTILLCSDGLYTLLTEEEILKFAPLGANAIVKYASKKVNDKLPDDTTAVIMQIKEIDEKIKLKSIKLPIPEKLKAKDEIDGYRLIRPLVQNERTWLAYKKGVEYVIKFAPFEAIEDEKALDMFVKEAWNARRLKAGYFPKAVIPKNRSYRYYIMEYIKGEELKKYVQKRVLTIDEGVDLAKFILQMSQYLLKYDLVHGDIKPENIIRRDRKGKTTFKMVDFGSITEIFSLTNRAGTPSYLAPERFKGESITESSEIFSMGVTLYEALTKKLPYGEIEPFQTPTFKKPTPPTKYNPKIPNWLESIILKAIAPNKEDRYQHFSEIMYDFKNPSKVKPFFDKSISIIEREPVKVYRSAFIISLLVNIYLLYLLLGGKL